MTQTTIDEGHTVSGDPTIDPQSEKHHEEIKMRVGSSASGSRTESISDFDPKAKTKRQRLLARVQFASLCWSMYVAGWNDGTTGPLLPRIQKVYGVSGFDACSISEVELLCDS